MADKTIRIVMEDLIEKSQTVGIGLSLFAEFVDRQKINDPNHTTPWATLTPDQLKAKINAFVDRQRFELCELWLTDEKSYRLFAKGFTPRDQLNKSAAELASGMPGTVAYPKFDSVIRRIPLGLDKEDFSPASTHFAATCVYHLDPSLLHGVSDPNHCKNYVKTHLSNNKGSLSKFILPAQVIELSHFQG